MNKTKIEWTDYTWNPITGCKTGCSYCYARKIAERFRGTKAFPNGFEPTFHEDRLTEPFKLRTPSKIFVCSMADMFGLWVPSGQIRDIISRATWPRGEHHTYQFLTKYPHRLRTFNPWPDNCWVGATATDYASYCIAYSALQDTEAIVRFISFEPLESGELLPGFRASDVPLASINWVIIGGQTNPIRLPAKSVVNTIIDSCGKYSVPVFLKDNLQPLFPGVRLRQEFPDATTTHSRR